MNNLENYKWSSNLIRKKKKVELIKTNVMSKSTNSKLTATKLTRKVFLKIEQVFKILNPFFK